MRIDLLPVGVKFRCVAIDKSGTLLHLSPGSATVQWDGVRTKTLGGRTFTVRDAPVTISRASDVVPLTEPN